MGKVYARQVNPAIQESPLGWYDEFPEDVIIFGNRNYKDHLTEEWCQIVANYDDAAEAWCSNLCTSENTEEIPTLSEILTDYGFKRRDGQPWSEEELKRWRTLFDDETCSGYDDCVKLEALSLMTGKAYACTELHGSSQGDWVDFYYPADEWDGKRIDEFEAAYFNTGSEWCICEDGSFDPESEDPDSIDGFYAYTSLWREADLKDWIAEMTGANPEDVVLYVWDHSTTHVVNSYKVC